MIVRLLAYRRALVVLGLKGVEAFSGAAMALYLARVMGPTSFGVFAFGIAITVLFAVPIKIGASTLITKTVAVERDSGKPQQVGPLLAAGIRFSLFYPSLITIGLWTTIMLYDNTNPFLICVALISLSLPFLCLTGLWEGVLRGNFRPHMAILVGTVLVPLAVLVLTSVFAEVLLVQGWRLASLVYVGAVIAVNILALALVWSYLGKLLPIVAESRISMADWLSQAAPFMVATGLLVFIRQIDVILLGVLTGEEEVGVYRIAAQAAVLVTFGVQAVAHLYAPYLARIDTDNGQLIISRYLRRSMLFSATFGLLILGVLGLWGIDIITILAGDAYLPGYPIMLTLCAANLAVALNGSAIQALNMLGHQKQMALIFAAVAIFTTIANSILISLYGVFGAAMATASAILLWSVSSRVLACRTWRLSFFTFSPLVRLK